MSNAYRVPVFESMSVAWNKTKGFKGTFWSAWVVAIIISIGLQLLMLLGNFIHPTLGLIVSFIYIVVFFILYLGIMYLGIKRAANMPVTYTDMFYAFKWPVFLRLIGVSICFTIIFGILTFLYTASPQLFGEQSLLKALFNLIILILIIFLSARLFFAYAFVLDQGVHSLEAIKLSWKVTQGNVFRIIGIIIIFSASYLLGLLALIIGLIWTIPFIWVYYGEIYKKFSDALLPVPVK